MILSEAALNFSVLSSADSEKIIADRLWNRADQRWCFSCSLNLRWKASNLWNSAVQRWLSLGFRHRRFNFYIERAFFTILCLLVLCHWGILHFTVCVLGTACYCTMQAKHQLFIKLDHAHNRKKRRKYCLYVQNYVVYAITLERVCQRNCFDNHFQNTIIEAKILLLDVFVISNRYSSTAIL